MLLKGMNLNTGIIQTTDRCLGGNRCISVCPILGANVALQADGNNRIYVDQEKCILCGKCIDVCTHGARVFQDDTERFFADLATSARRGRKISLIVAPSFIVNYPTKYRKILGYLAHLGVNHIYSASLGADITVWAYINYLSTYQQKGLISQPCPAIVNFIEKHAPNLIKNLIPVQSPIMCAAIYMRKYLGIDDDIAFISPCIAKKYEIERPENAGLIQYNVTYENLIKAIDGEDISMYDASESEMEYGMGALFSEHGGLRTNIENYLGSEVDSFVNQKEGESQAYNYLRLYSERAEYDDPFRARLIDILNCSRGCNYGTATEFRHAATNHIPYMINKLRVEKMLEANAGEPLPLPPAEKLAALNRRFEGLRLADFHTSYTDRMRLDPKPTQEQLQKIFRDMHKYTAQDQDLDCNSCGYSSCTDMATAIALGYNHKFNCVDYMKKQLLMEHSESQVQREVIARLQMASSDHNAMHIDQLTGLVNRSGYHQAVETSLKRASAQGSVCLLFHIDLDDFMSINKSYGFDFGNSLLVEVAKQLQAITDTNGQVFRIGGDEFSILVENTNTLAAKQMAEKLLERMRQPWEIANIRTYCSCSIGVARYPDADDSVGDIIKNAELAAYKVKQGGKNDFLIYDHIFEYEAHENLDLIRQMRDAVAENFQRFELNYQPWVGPKGQIVGAEALLRWRDDSGAPVPPNKFIPVAETTGLIYPIGLFVLRNAAQTLRRINEHFPDFRMSINVSNRQFARDEIYDDFAAIVKEVGVEQKNLFLEMTESLELENMAQQKSTIDRFVHDGFSIALDDFGTGYSSLNYLTSLPLSLVKLDRSFIRNVETDPSTTHLLKAMTALMQTLGKTVCVEGVETKFQKDLCNELNVDIIQGFFYYRPMPLAELLTLLGLAN